MAAGMLSEHHLVMGQSDRLGSHDLIRCPVREHSVLVNTGLVREGIVAHNRLVRLTAHAGCLGHLARGLPDPGGINPGGHVVVFLAGVQIHHDFLERGVAGALPESVNGTFNLVGTGQGRSQAVGDSEPQVIMAMYGEYGLVHIRDVIADVPDQGGVLLGNRVAHGIRNIDGGGSRSDNTFYYTVHKLRLRAGGVFQGKLHIAAEISRVFDHRYRLLVYLVRCLLELVLHVKRARGEKRMNAGACRFAERLPGCIDIFFQSAGKGRNGHAADVLCDRLYRFEISGTGNGKPGFNNVHAEACETFRHFKFVLQVHAAAG